MNTLRSNLARMFLGVFSSAVILVAGVAAQDSNETLASTDNAYNPIPSPDGRYIAYVRTGWGRPGGSGGFGRSNLVSEVIVIDEKAVPTTAMPLADMFWGDGRLTAGSWLALETGSTHSSRQMESK